MKSKKKRDRQFLKANVRIKGLKMNLGSDSNKSAGSKLSRRTVKIARKKPVVVAP